jgi:hypothetical protein
LGGVVCDFGHVGRFLGIWAFGGLLALRFILWLLSRTYLFFWFSIIFFVGAVFIIALIIAHISIIAEMVVTLIAVPIPHVGGAD